MRGVRRDVERGDAGPGEAGDVVPSVLPVSAARVLRCMTVLASAPAAATPPIEPTVMKVAA